MSNTEENIKANAKLRLAQRREYIRQIYNPHRHMTAEGGHLFDTGIQRYMTARYCAYPYFKPTKKTALIGLGLLVLPVFAYGYAIKWERNYHENRYRSGQVSYADRYPKWL